MQEIASGFLKVQAFRSGVRGDKDAHRVLGIIECGLDVVALGLVHVPVQRKDCAWLRVKGAKAAVEVCGGAPIGVLATTGTIRSEAYVRAVARFDSSVEVIGQACPKFVPLIESGLADSEEAEEAARDCVQPLLAQGAGTIILGCTHYPFLARPIQAAAGPDVTIVDPAEETAGVLANILLERGILSERLDAPHEFFASGDASGFATLGSAFLGRTIERVEHAKELSVGGYQLSVGTTMTDD